MKNVPDLRFFNFKEPWKLTTLGDVSESLSYGMNAAATEYDGVNKYIRITDIDEKTHRYNPENIVSPLGELSDEYLVGENDILFARTGASTGKTYLYSSDDGKLYYAGFLIKAHIKSNVDAKFVFYQTQREIYKNWVKVMSMRSGQPGINSSEYATFSFLIPSLKEQQKISAFFSLIDKKIEKQQEKIDALESYKKGMMQKIFSQKIRFKDENGKEYPMWERKTFRDILLEVKRPVEKPNEPYWRLGIRSHGRGTFHEFVENPNDIRMDTLYKVEKDDLIVNITFAWEHAIAIANEEDQGKLVSHRFPTYRFLKDKAIPSFFKHYILMPIVKYSLANASPGGAGRNRVLNKSQFLDIPIPLPSIDEQKKIGAFLTAIDKKIEKEKEKLNLLYKLKKGLLQKMFV